MLLTFAPLAYNLSVGMVVSASTRASEIRLFGNGTVLRTTDGSSLLTMLPGAPPVLLHGFTLHGKLDVQAGLLNVNFCSVEGSHALLGGALSLTAGGRVEARNTTFFQNIADGDGGAVYVDGGSALFHGCRFLRNVAGGDGGALFVRSGFVVLREGTRLAGNSAAGSGNSIFMLQSGSITYTLPAPLGHWVEDASGAASAFVSSDATDSDYPFACVRHCPPNAFARVRSCVLMLAGSLLHGSRPVCTAIHSMHRPVRRAPGSARLGDSVHRPR